MILTIVSEDHDGPHTHVWRTGDPVEDLEHAAHLLLQYANHLKTPSTTAALAQQPLPTNGTTTSY